MAVKLSTRDVFENIERAIALRFQVFHAQGVNPFLDFILIRDVFTFVMKY